MIMVIYCHYTIFLIFYNLFFKIVFEYAKKRTFGSAF